MSKQTILVTGGAGFIGSSFVRLLLAREPEVTVVNFDALTYAGNLASLADCLDDPRHIFVKGDIRDAETVEATIRKHGVDGIINFAAESHVDRSITGPQVFIETNVGGTLNLLVKGRDLGVKRFLQVSTDEVYGSLGDEGFFTEATPLSPNSPYSASKAGADHLVHAFHETYGMDTVITRCSNNYGPYQFPEKLVPLMIRNALADEALPVYGTGLNVRDWLYVDDHCQAIWAAFTRGTSGEVYNIGGNNEWTNLAVVKTILGLLDKPESLITFVGDRLGHDHRYAIDASKIARDLDWRPTMEFDGGIAKTIEWYLSHQEWVDQVASGEYQNYYETNYANRGGATSA
ncbi:MAG: dTDP-glucose 4,6-dehydratase [Victivallales bacterium]|jgi:dTDP-glucose 4,6-dehydratase|nr:dTDP-glucose 4,6-dehydratase [Victivallales bacterium]